MGPGCLGHKITKRTTSSEVTYTLCAGYEQYLSVSTVRQPLQRQMWLVAQNLPEVEFSGFDLNRNIVIVVPVTV